LKGERELKAEAFTIAKARDLLFYCENYLNQSLVTAHRTVKNAKIILQWGLQQGLVLTNPLFQWRGEVAPAKEIIFLEVEELARIEKFECPGRPGLERVRDLFLFQCYTGLDYGCTQTFIPAEHIRKDPAGRLWIYKKRAKNGSQAVVPLFPEALELLHKYQGTDLLGEVCHMPRISNQKYNEALKEIAGMCNIDKFLTTHVGRKTFGTIALNKGFTVVAVSKMLGHRFTKTTETHYAQVLAGRVEMEFSQVSA
jgi:integrase